jgi:hypothetical protein
MQRAREEFAWAQYVMYLPYSGKEVESMRVTPEPSLTTRLYTAIIILMEYPRQLTYPEAFQHLFRGLSWREENRVSLARHIHVT